jgi:hypothetical protein
LSVPNQVDLASSSAVADNGIDMETGATVVKGFQWSETANLEQFCSNLLPGIYCHPELSKVQVYCPRTADAIPKTLECPVQHVCRSHRKLRSLKTLGAVNDADQAQTIDEAMLHFPQCVHEDDLDLDAYCEDQVEELANTRWTESMASERILLLDYLHSTSTDESSQLVLATKVCNPFQSSRKQVLYCAVRENDCGHIISGSGK